MTSKASTARTGRVLKRRRAVALAHHYRDVEDLSIRQIADCLGRSPATVKEYFYDPTGEKARAVKARYQGVCRGCGAYTQPRNGKGDAFAYCKACHPGAIGRRWTRDRVLDAMRAWGARYGRLRSSYDWARTHARRRGGEALERLREGWRLSVVMDKFGPAPIDELDFGLADELVIELCEERAAIERAAAEGVPLMRAVRDSRTGTSYEARRRGVSNGSIRKALDAAERVLRDAKKRGVLVGEVPALKSAAPKVERAHRSFLEAEQIAAVLRAADLIEAERRGLTWERVDLIRSSSRSAVSLARELGVSDTLIRKVRRGELWNGGPPPRNRNDVPRRVVIDTLILGGLRVSELCGLDGPHLDIAGGRLRVPRSATKSDAGERNIPIVPALRQGLTEHRTEYPSGQGQPAFPTRNGTRQHPDNIRARILAPIRERANEQLEAEGRLPIAHMTPHTLRRTFASMLAVCDVPPRRAMYLMGHTDPTLTLAVYQQVLDMGKGAVEILEQTLGCTLAEARAIYNGEARAAEVDERA